MQECVLVKTLWKCGRVCELFYRLELFLVWMPRKNFNSTFLCQISIFHNFRFFPQILFRTLALYRKLLRALASSERENKNGRMKFSSGKCADFPLHCNFYHFYLVFSRLCTSIKSLEGLLNKNSNLSERLSTSKRQNEIFHWPRKFFPYKTQTTWKSFMNRKRCVFCISFGLFSLPHFPHPLGIISLENSHFSSWVQI